MNYQKVPLFRSEPLRRLVASLPCMECGLEGHTQASHRNEGKAMGAKTSDALLAALCTGCHSWLDQGKDMTQAERRDFWNRACIKTYQALIESGQLAIKGNQ